MKEQIKNYLGIVGLILGVTLIILSVVEIKNRTSSYADISKTRTIVMSAEGKVNASPNIANLSFAVVTQGSNAEQVQQENDEKMQTVINYLKSSGIEEKDIQTSGYNLYPQFDYSRPDVTPPTITGYNLSQNVSAKIRDLSKVSGTVGGLTSVGVNQINNVSFNIEDPDNLRSEVREQAIEKAKQKAEELAGNLGIKLGKVINFSEGAVSTPYPIPYAERNLGSGGASPIEPGNQEVIVGVTLTFEIK